MSNIRTFVVSHIDFYNNELESVVIKADATEDAEIEMDSLFKGIAKLAHAKYPESQEKEHYENVKIDCREAQNIEQVKNCFFNMDAMVNIIEVK